MAQWLVKRPASKLALRIYLFGLAQFVIVMIGMFLILAYSQRPPLPFVRTLGFMVETIADTGGDRAQVARVVDRLRSSLRCSVAIYDEGGHLVAHDPLASAPDRRSDVVLAAPDLSAPIVMRGGARWQLVFLAPPPVTTPPVIWSWISLVVVGVGVFSLLIARSLARPLARLAAAAHDLGAGKLDTRVRLNRSDELGQVATAFDRMADRVAHALRVEKELLANVSHELRTPLQRIHIAVELAAEGDSQTARESLTEIAEDLGELERIVEDVLTATRLSLRDGLVSSSSGAPPMRPEAVDLRALVDKAATRFTATHPKRPLAVTVAGDLPAMTADPVLLRRVVDNLLDNAHKYTEDPASEISLTVGRSSGGVMIEVRDRGGGIAPDELARVFEPFFRAERSRNRATGGLGLGLALARSIVEAHGGTLTLESAIGSGTGARVALPIVRPILTASARGNSAVESAEPDL